MSATTLWLEQVISLPGHKTLLRLCYVPFSHDATYVRQKKRILVIAPTSFSGEIKLLMLALVGVIFFGQGLKASKFYINAPPLQVSVPV